MNDILERQLEDLLRAQAFRAVAAGEITLNGNESDAYWADMGAALASDMFSRRTQTPPMSERALEDSLYLLYSQDAAAGLEGLGKAKRKKKKKGVARDIAAPAQEIKKVGQKLSPKSLAQHAKRTAQRINKEVKKVAKRLAPYIRKIIIAIIVIVIIYYTAGYALPIVLRYLKQRGISASSAGGKQAIADEISRQQQKMAGDPAYLDQMKREYGNDPALVADVEAMKKEEDKKKAANTALAIGIPIAALVAIQALS